MRETEDSVPLLVLSFERFELVPLDHTIRVRIHLGVFVLWSHLQRDLGTVEDAVAILVEPIELGLRLATVGSSDDRRRRTANDGFGWRGRCRRDVLDVTLAARQISRLRAGADRCRADIRGPVSRLL